MSGPSVFFVLLIVQEINGVKERGSALLRKMLFLLKMWYLLCFSSSKCGTYFVNDCMDLLQVSLLSSNDMEQKEGEKT